MLTIDDIYDPQKRVNFSGASPQLTWLADGLHYLQWNSDPKRGAIGLAKVEASSGKIEPLFDEARMKQALTAAGISAEEANRLADQTTYSFNPAQTAILLNHSNDLYYYELSGQRAIRLTNSRS